MRSHLDDPALNLRNDMGDAAPASEIWVVNLCLT